MIIVNDVPETLKQHSLFYLHLVSLPELDDKTLWTKTSDVLVIGLGDTKLTLTRTVPQQYLAFIILEGAV